MLELLFVALGTFTAFVGLSALLPFSIPPRFSPLVVSAMAYGLLRVPVSGHQFVEALACASVAAIVYRIAGPSELPEPWTLPRITWPKRKPPPRTGPVGNRIPRL